MKLRGNTVLITGGSTGIGFALAGAFLNSGSEVIICGRREERLLEARKKLPGINIKRCDVSDAESRVSLVSWAIENFPELNVVVNNAGIQQDIDLREGPKELLEGESEIKIDLEAPVFLSSLFISHLLSAKEPAIINVSSALGLTPLASMPVYCAAKAGLHIFTKCLRAQLKNSGIKVFELLPPGLDTELNMKGRQRRGAGSYSMMPLGDYIAYVMHSLENDVFEIMNPQRENMKDVTLADLNDIFDNMNRQWR